MTRLISVRVDGGPPVQHDLADLARLWHGVDREATVSATGDLDAFMEWEAGVCRCRLVCECPDYDPAGQ
jgi:hypothetical protein